VSLKGKRSKSPRGNAEGSGLTAESLPVTTGGIVISSGTGGHPHDLQREESKKVRKGAVDRMGKEKGNAGAI